MGVVPCLPGFVAAVNTSVTVSDGAIELYYLNYLFGFLTSGLLFILVHWAFPDEKTASFVSESPSAKELQQLYGQRWNVTLADVPDVSDEVSVETNVQKEHEAANAKV